MITLLLPRDMELFKTTFHVCCQWSLFLKIDAQCNLFEKEIFCHCIGCQIHKNVDCESKFINHEVKVNDT